MHMFAAALFALISVISPTRVWYPPAQPLTINVKSEGDASLVLTDFDGKQLPAKESVEFSKEKSVDLLLLYPQLMTPGTYVLYEVPKGKPLAQFEGTPLVIEVRSDQNRGGAGGAEVTHVGPLEYAVINTDQGPITAMFYYDVAPITVASFLDLSRTGYYDSLTFHRIAPGFVIQGGDPKGDGTGGPGYHVPAEFNERPHLEGVLSMARASDPNSGGSQFFICLDYGHTKQLDRSYTAFGRVTSGMEAVKKIAAAPLAGGNGQDGKPVTPQVIKTITVKPVTAEENPYSDFFHLKDAK
ncbi:MAG TPA: peptidylprolyl isomerase [Tepidisphaeraceae bacterium]|nr:peptidylprolyl isomerase [Tepidisphaeraceae bacterium]